MPLKLCLRGSEKLWTPAAVLGLAAAAAAAVAAVAAVGAVVAARQRPPSSAPAASWRRAGAPRPQPPSCAVASSPAATRRRRRRLQRPSTARAGEGPRAGCPGAPVPAMEPGAGAEGALLRPRWTAGAAASGDS